MQQTVSIIIRGKVQGVYFRQSAVEEALKLGVNGTVCNLPDGNVEVIATGTQDELKKLADWCHRGPKRAQVDSVEINTIPTRHFESFNIIR